MAGVPFDKAFGPRMKWGRIEREAAYHVVAEYKGHNLQIPTGE